MPSFTYPGVYTTEQLVGPSPAAILNSPSVAAFIGEHWRGPVNTALLCTSWAQFVQIFGGFNPSAVPVLANPYLAFSVYSFFNGGGQACWVVRVGSSLQPGTTASLTLLDSSATPQGTLKLTAGRLGTAGNPGTWGNNLYASVVARGGAGSGRFDLTIFYGGSSGQYQVENWIDLSMSSADPRYAVSVLNSPVAGSVWVVADDLGDSATPPNNTPQVISGAQFAGGIDGSDPSSSDLTNAVTVGSSPLDSVNGMLSLNLPGQSTSAVIGAAIAFAEQRQSTFLVIDPPSGLTTAGVVSYFQSLSPVSSYAALYYPWVIAPDPSSSSYSATRLLPPGGFVLGQYTATDTSAGVWKAPAGLNAQLGVLQTQNRLSQADIGTLTQANVNALRTLANGGVVIWGTRTMETGYASLYVPIRRTLNYIEETLINSLQFAVFQPNDQTLWDQIAAIVSQFLTGLYAQGAFVGSSLSQAFFVQCDSTNNTPQSIAQGIVNTNVGVAFTYPAEFINILISQNQASGTTTVTNG